MTILKKVTSTLCLILIICTNLKAAENLFEEAKKNLKKKNMTNQNFYFKEILFLIQKTQSRIFI